jgi:ankyrin repeat protein
LMLNGKRIETARLFPIDRFIEDMEFPPLSRIVMGDLHVDLGEALQSPEYAADINFVSEVGWTPLDIAVHKGDVGAMKLLIKAGADLNVATGPRASTPLLRACINGNYEAAKVLLEAGADARKQDRDANGPITNAAKAEVDTSRLISLLMRYGIDIETPGGPSQSPPLVLAVVEGTAETVRYLLSRGANINWRDGDGDTPIIDAIIRGHCDKVELLMEHGCNIQNVNNEGQGVLHFVASHGTRDVMKVFASKKITKLDPGAKDKQGRTPMNYFNGRHPPPTPEYRETFDEMLDSLERGFYGVDADSDGQEFFDAGETLN